LRGHATPDPGEMERPFPDPGFARISGRGSQHPILAIG